MAEQREVRIRRGPAANLPSFTPAAGELLFVTDTKQVRVGDGVTPGGHLVGPATVLGPATRPGFLPDRRYSTHLRVGFDTTSALVAADVLAALPFYVPEPTDFVELGLQVDTAAASAEFRLGVYSDDGGPDALLFETAALDASTAGVKVATISETLAAGLYWLAIVGNSSSVLYRCTPRENMLSSLDWRDTFANTGASQNVLQVAHTFGALPDPMNWTTPAAFDPPLIFLGT